MDEFLNKCPVYSYFNFLQTSQWWSESEIETYQNEKLRLIVDHACVDY
jgi:hypothetical protein